MSSMLAPDGCRAAQLTGVTTHLVPSVDVDAGQAHVWVFDDSAQRAGADGPR